MDNEKDGCEDVELLHCVLLSVADLLERPHMIWVHPVKWLFNVCRVLVWNPYYSPDSGELSRRTGVSAELLRARERAWAAHLTRTGGGFRLTAADERRVSLMRSHLKHGMSAAEAARLTLTEADGGTRDDDEPPQRRAQEIFARRWTTSTRAPPKARLTRSRGVFDRDCTTDLVLPYPHELGEAGRAARRQVVRSTSPANSSEAGLGPARAGIARRPRALLACAPGEQHDLANSAWRRSARPRLAHHVPPASDDATWCVARLRCPSLGPLAIVISSVSPDRLSTMGAELRRLATLHCRVVAGPGASEVSPAKTQATFLEVDPGGRCDHVVATRP